MSRIEWSRREPGEIETALGVMLCRENPHAVRRRPSRGDGGIDVYIPDENGRWTVYQIKSFTGSLTSSQKRQIAESWESFQETVRTESIEVARWYLLRPENPTREDESWLASLTADVQYQCTWRGLDHCERLAADNPSVVDYYFHDGRARLENALETLLAVIHRKDGVPLDANRSRAVLADVHASVNEHDPHYRYDFSVEAVTPGRDMTSVPSEPGMVAAVIQSDGVVAITFKVIARYLAAVVDRPIPGSFNVRVEPGSAAEVAWKDFVDYGIATEATVEAMSIDLPAGLGGTFNVGTLRLGPSASDSGPPFNLELQVESPDGDPVAAAIALMQPPTSGASGAGFGITGTSDGGAFDLTVRADAPPARSMRLSISGNDLAGLRPGRVIESLRALQEMRPPNRVRLRIQDGPEITPATDLEARVAGDLGDVLVVVEALAVIQRHTFVPITIPDLAQTTNAQANEWLRVAALLRGETVGMRWSANNVGFTDQAGAASVWAALEESSGALDFPMAFSVSIAGVEIDLGEQLVHLNSATVDPSFGYPVDGSPQLLIVPAGDDRGTVRYGGAGASEVAVSSDDAGRTGSNPVSPTE